MKFIRLIIFFLFMLMMMPSIFYGGIISKIEIIGFSKDGIYLAYLHYYPLYGEREDETWVSQLFIFNISENRYVTKTIELEEDFPVFYDNDDINFNEELKYAMILDTLKVKSVDKASNLIKKYGIVLGNIGYLALNHIITDLNPFDCYKVKFSWPYNSGQWVTSSGSNECELVMNVIVDSSVSDCPDYLGKEYPEFFELDINYDSGRIKIKLQESRLQTSIEKCIYHYCIERVYLYNKQIVVLINSWRLGFEGANIVQMVVSGTILIDD